MEVFYTIENEVVVSRETAILDLTYASLIVLDIMAADIYNIYRTAHTTEKFYIIYSMEFECKNLDKWALYITNSTVWDFINHLCGCMYHLC